MYDFDKKSKQNIQAIYYIESTFVGRKKTKEGEKEALISEISLHTAVV